MHFLFILPSILSLFFIAACGDLVGDIEKSSSSIDLEGMRIQIESGNNQSQEAGALLLKPLVVRVVNGDGVPLKDQMIEFSIVEGDGKLQGESKIATDQEGRASSELSLGELTGEMKVRAEIFPNVLEDPLHRVEFQVMAIQPREAQLFLVDGDSQVGVVQSTFQKPLLVRAKDRFGNPVSGVEVKFNVLEGDAAVEPSAITDENGIAKSIVTIGGTPGDIIIEAAWYVDGKGRKVLFRLLSQSIVLRLVSTLTSSSTCVGEGKTYPTITFEVVSEGDQLVSNQRVKLHVLNGSIDAASFETPVEKRTDSNGRVSFKVKAGTVQRGSTYYDDQVVLVASLVGVVGSEPWTRRMTVTENLWVTPIAPEILYLPSNWGPAWVQGEISSNVKKACGAKGASVDVTFQSRSRAGCPPDRWSSRSDWGSFSTGIVDRTDSNGVSVHAYEFPIFSYYAGLISHQIRVSVAGGNQATFYLASTGCK